MIFFTTFLIPSSNISVKLKIIQKKLFEDNIIIPSPFPLILCSVSAKKPKRPSRSIIAENYPSEIIPTEFKAVKKNLMMMFSKPFYTDRKETIIEGILFGQINPSTSSNSYPELDENLSFKNYSLASFKVHSDSMDQFWMNMYWEKLWEVQKKRT